MLRAAESILGPSLEAVQALDLAPDEAPAPLRARIDHVLRALASPDGVLVLTDLLGGTPYRVALELLREECAGKVALVAGMSLPVVLEALLQRHAVSSVEELARAALRAGSEHLRICDLERMGQNSGGVVSPGAGG